MFSIIRRPRNLIDHKDRNRHSLRFEPESQLILHSSKNRGPGTDRQQGLYHPKARLVPFLPGVQVILKSFVAPASPCLVGDGVAQIPAHGIDEHRKCSPRSMQLPAAYRKIGRPVRGGGEFSAGIHSHQRIALPLLGVTMKLQRESIRQQLLPASAKAPQCSVRFRARSSR